jgi:hypothetical protein
MVPVASQYKLKPVSVPDVEASGMSFACDCVTVQLRAAEFGPTGLRQKPGPARRGIKLQ